MERTDWGRRGSASRRRTASLSPGDECGEPVAVRDGLAHRIMSKMVLTAGPPASLWLGASLQREIGFRVRLPEVRRRVVVNFRPLRPWRLENEPSLHITFCETPDDAIFREILQRLAHELAVIALRPLTPKQLLALAPISNRERLRWTKDGRLPPSGSILIRRGHLVAVPTYGISTVERILNEPSIIEQWRADDEAARR